MFLQGLIFNTQTHIPQYIWVCVWTQPSEGTSCWHQWQEFGTVHIDNVSPHPHPQNSLLSNASNFYSWMEHWEWRSASTTRPIMFMNPSMNGTCITAQMLKIWLHACNHVSTLCCLSVLRIYASSARKPVNCIHFFYEKKLRHWIN